MATEEAMIKRGEAEARRRLALAIKEERRTSSQPPGYEARDKAVEDLRDAEAVAREWMI